MQEKKNLLSLVHQSNQLEEQILSHAENNLGEVDPTLDAFLFQVEKDLVQKVDNYKYYLDRLEMVAEHLDLQADKFTRASSAVTNFQERLKSKIVDAMRMQESEVLKGDTWLFKLVRNPASLKVTNVEALPPEYVSKRVVEETVVDKDSLKKYLVGGGVVNGAEVTYGYRVKSSVNKEIK